MQASWLYRSNTKEFIHNWCSDAVYFTNKTHPIFQHLYLYIPPNVYFLNDSRFHRCYPITIPQRGRCQLGTLNEFDPVMKSWRGEGHTLAPCVVCGQDQTPVAGNEMSGMLSCVCHPPHLQTPGGICDPWEMTTEISSRHSTQILDQSSCNVLISGCDDVHLKCCTPMFSDYQRGGGTIWSLFMSL